MSKRTSKSGVITVIVVTFVIIALLNIVTFVIPFNKVDKAVHFTVYGCAEFVLIAEMILIISQIFLQEKSNQKINSLPVVYFGYITVIIQLLATAIFYLINGFIALPLWVVIIIESLIFAFGIIQVAKGFFFKSRNNEYHENIANTKFMDEFRAKLKTLQVVNKNANIEKELTDLVDIALGSDPITNDKTVELESKLLSSLYELEDAIKEGSEENTRLSIEKTKNLLLERNILCKTGK